MTPEAYILAMARYGIDRGQFQHRFSKGPEEFEEPTPPFVKPPLTVDYSYLNSPHWLRMQEVGEAGGKAQGRNKRKRALNKCATT